MIDPDATINDLMLDIDTFSPHVSLCTLKLPYAQPVNGKVTSFYHWNVGDSVCVSLASRVCPSKEALPKPSRNLERECGDIVVVMSG
jgi:hypothetical protein